MSNSNLKNDISALTASVTKSWKEAKRKADRKDRVSRNQLMRMSRPARVSVRDVAFRVMESAYNKASSNGRYYANARQIMYAARPAILAEADTKELNDQYFTQTLLKDYIEEFRPNWKVVWDARGHLEEPHTAKRLGLGGLAVKQYVDQWGSGGKIENETPEIPRRIPTHGPRHRFSNVLFVEKEGFSEILDHAGIAERYDMAIMSTKGVPVAAACDVIETMALNGVRVFVLHDFDRDGFKILRTLRNGTRLAYGTDVIDLGLRMADIEGLPSEPVTYYQRGYPLGYLLAEGDLTPEEADFLVSGGYPGFFSGQRVEINAMTSEQLVTWLERKFAEHDVQKVVPDSDTLKAAYQRAAYLQRMEKEIARLREEIDADETPIPEDLAAQVETILKQNPRMSWDLALWQVVKGATDEDDDLGADE